MAKQKESRYRVLVLHILHSDSLVHAEELEKQMKKMKGWTLSQVERTIEPGYIGCLLKFLFIK